MSQPKTNEKISPQVFQVWKDKAEASEEFADEWRDYALMMATFQAALERAPRTIEVCEDVNIERLLITELEYLADTVNAVFPRGGMMEFASYVTGSQRVNVTNAHYLNSAWKEAELTRKAVNANRYEEQAVDYQPRNVAVGQGCMVMTSEDFVNGYQAGHLSYMLEARAVTVTDEALIALIMSRLASKDYSECYNAGYVVGWIAALASKEKKGGPL
ncbi:MAG: hypothetical protein ABI234_03095 [Ktedonobacteraceae bacterium]